MTKAENVKDITALLPQGYIRVKSFKRHYPGGSDIDLKLASTDFELLANPHIDWQEAG
jgi:hypothetical protein